MSERHTSSTYTFLVIYVLTGTRVRESGYPFPGDFYAAVQALEGQERVQFQEACEPHRSGECPAESARGHSSLVPCVYPIPAWRPKSPVSGEKRVLIGTPVREFDEVRGQEALVAAELLLPCGSCVGCQISRAREWAIRCSLELQLHSVASFVTLTYSERHVPPTLSRSHLSHFVRYMRRKVGSFRFFGCGEYGELRERPHYHAILFGTADEAAAEQSWGKGFVTMSEVTPERVSYVAGYCAKKLGFFRPKGEEVDYTTGEIYEHQPPFLQMSRNPGIAGEFKKFARSWRKTAIWQGREFPVPRFLHASWQESASDQEKAALELERQESRGVPTVRELLASEDIASARIRLKSERAQL